MARIFVESYQLTNSPRFWPAALIVWDDPKSIYDLWLARDNMIDSIKCRDGKGNCFIARRNLKRKPSA